MSKKRTESAEFLHFAIARVWQAAGASAEHAEHVAQAITFAHRQGKLNQGLGVYEALDIALQMGMLDIKAEPELVSEGPGWAVVDGRRSTGYWTINVMADLAIAKAREQGIAIAFGANHNDAGSISAYVYKAYQQDMMAFASNNAVPLAAPYGGMFNRLAVAPFDALCPNGEQPPVWASVALAEFYDADVSEAALNDQPLKGQWLIDPESGELSDDVRPYARPVESYGRVWDCTAAGQIEEPRTYAINLWNEALCSLLNPMGVPSSRLPTVESVTSGQADPSQPTVGGSYYIAIDPSVFGPLAAVRQRSDDFMSDILGCPPRPGHSVRAPGQKGYEHLQAGEDSVEVLDNHWAPFFGNIAGRYGLTEQGLRDEFNAG